MVKTNSNADKMIRQLVQARINRGMSWGSACEQVAHLLQISMDVVLIASDELLLRKRSNG